MPAKGRGDATRAKMVARARTVAKARAAAKSAKAALSFSFFHAESGGG